MPLYGIFIYIAVVIMVYVFRLLPEERVEASNDAFISVACLFGFYNLWRVSKQFEKGERTGFCWFLFSLGLLCEGIGHVIYSVQEFAYNTYLTFPNVADVLIIIGAGFYIYSLHLFLHEINRLQLFPDSHRKLIANIITLVIVVLTAYFIVYPVMVDDSEPLWLRLAYQIYPVIDIFLAWYSFHLLLAFSVMGFSPVSKPWLVIVLAFMAFFITDTAYAYYEVLGLYHPYLLINPGWGLSYLLMSYASYLQIKLMDQLRPVS